MKKYMKVNQPTLKVEDRKSFIPMKLQYFNGDPPPGGGGTPPSDPPPPADPPTDPPADPPKSFSQDEVNGFVAKEAKKAQEKLLKQLGIEDFDNAKEGLNKFKEWQETQKTEQEKQEERMKELETNYSTTSEENTSLKAQISAMKAGVLSESVEDVVTLAKTMVNDDVDMDAAIAKVVEKYPQFSQAQQEEEQKPSFSTGLHKKAPSSQDDQWANAFK